MVAEGRESRDGRDCVAVVYETPWRVDLVSKRVKAGIQEYRKGVVIVVAGNGGCQGGCSYGQ